MLTIPLNQIRLSKTNPRRRRDPKADAELAESVRAHGVLQPVLVRAIEENGKPWELVLGSRRYGAAKEAGLQEIPAIDKKLSDVEVLEVQVIENLQRADVHPLEEAEAYEQLTKRHGYSVDEIAAKVGKSRAYVYARMKLCALGEKGRAAFFDGKLEASTALLVARIPPALQAEALQGICGRGSEAEAMSYRRASDFVQREYMLRLADAPFDPKDGDLVPAAGPCGTCPKRTGNQSELFGDVKGADVCTDPGCFRQKSAAAAALRVKAARESGQSVIEGPKAKKLFNGSELSYGVPYWDLDEPARSIVPGAPYTEKKLRAVLAKGLTPERIVIAIDGDGRAHELVARQDLPAIAKAAGIKERSRGAADPSAQRYEREQKRKAKIAKAHGRAMVAALLEKAKKAPLEKLWPIVEAFIYQRSMNDAEVEVLKARGIERTKVRRSWGMALEDGEQAIRRWLAGQPKAEQPGLAREIALQVIFTNDAPGPHVDQVSGPVLTVAGKVLGVDLKAISDRARREVAEEEKKSRAKRGAKKKGGAAPARKRGRAKPSTEASTDEEDAG